MNETPVFTFSDCTVTFVGPWNPAPIPYVQVDRTNPPAWVLTAAVEMGLITFLSVRESVLACWLRAERAVCKELHYRLLQAVIGGAWIIAMCGMMVV